MDGTKVALAILGAALVYKLGKEAAYEEFEQLGFYRIETESFEEAQRENAGLQ